MMMRDMYTFWPTYVPVIIFALIYLFSSWFIIILVPQHKAGDWLIFSRSITGWPTFSLSSWFGIPGNFKLMKNVIGFHAAACRCFAHVVWAMVHHFFTFYLVHYVLIYLSYHFVFLHVYSFLKEFWVLVVSNKQLWIGALSSIRSLGIWIHSSPSMMSWNHITHIQCLLSKILDLWLFLSLDIHLSCMFFVRL